jgi:acylphosphatase
MVAPGGEKIVQVMIKGRVQGVGFRFWLEMEAASLGVRGWVRNRSHGGVEALIAGPPDAVEALCAACWRGPTQARVERVEVREADAAALAEHGVGPGFRSIATL